MLYGIMCEDNSDVDTLKVLVRRLSIQHVLKPPKFQPKAYEGWARMFEKGVSQMKLFADLGCNKIIICFDADGPVEKAIIRREKIRNEIASPSNVDLPFCALVPIQELEAWILADLSAVSKVLTSLRVKEDFKNPERINSPKERLIKISRCPITKKAKYHPPTHNERVAAYLNLETVESKCPSFGILVDFVTGKPRGERKVKKKRQRRRW